MSKTNLAYITFMQFGLSAAIDAGDHANVSIANVKKALKAKNAFPWLKTALPNADFSVYEDERGELLTKFLREEDMAFEGRERRKLGIEKNGIAYLLSLTIELIQSLKWIDDRVTIHPPSPPVRP